MLYVANVSLDKKLQGLPVNGFLDQLFALGIQCTRCFIQHLQQRRQRDGAHHDDRHSYKNFRIANQGSSNGHTLLLSPRQGLSSFTNGCVITLRQSRDKIMRICFLGRRLNFLDRRIRLAIRNVVGNTRCYGRVVTLGS